ncbi:MAG: cell division protein FtsL [Nitrospinaceae bacterium]
MFDHVRRLAKIRWNISSRRVRMTLGVSLLFLIGAMAFVWPNVKMVKMAYEYQILAQERRSLLKENHLLRVERGSLQSLDRIQSLAQKHTQLELPRKGQVVTIFLK